MRNQGTEQGKGRGHINFSKPELLGSLKLQFYQITQGENNINGLQECTAQIHYKMEGKMTENLLGNNYSCKGAEV